MISVIAESPNGIIDFGPLCLENWLCPLWLFLRARAGGNGGTKGAIPSFTNGPPKLVDLPPCLRALTPTRIFSSPMSSNRARTNTVPNRPGKKEIMN